MICISILEYEVFQDTETQTSQFEYISKYTTSAPALKISLPQTTTHVYLAFEITLTTGWSGTQISSVARTYYQIKRQALANSLQYFPSLFQQKKKKKRTQHGVGFKSIIKLQNHTLFSAGPTEAKFLFGGRRVPYNRKNNCARFNQKWKGSCECSLGAT